jgi:transcriptional regulator with XRE-family HTH domain
VTRSIHSTRYDRLTAALIAARQAAGMTQMEVAKKLRRPQSFVSKYERGERRLDVVEFVEVTDALKADAARIIECVR